jgi:SAM-dependent methyltransferase
MSDDYVSRLKHEAERFNAEICVHDLPEIAHYWSNKYLSPLLAESGYQNIDDFFIQEIYKAAQGKDFLNMTSVGSGDCAVEVRVAQGLISNGFSNFTIDYLDISGMALQRGIELVESLNLSSNIKIFEHDFNTGLLDKRYDIVLANQSLHHVVNLEKLFSSIQAAIEPDGCLLVSDMIGRNGHQRWPEAKNLVDELWLQLPESYRYNRQLCRMNDVFLDWDCSQEGFEGIRAQDVLPLLLEYFKTNVFIVWGNIIDVFIDRGFGHNFNVNSKWDCNFIDKVHEIDCAAIKSKTIKPTHLLAKFDLSTKTCIHHNGLAPNECVRQVSS